MMTKAEIDRATCAAICPECGHEGADEPFFWDGDRMDPCVACPACGAQYEAEAFA